jgi:hypothetical protein
LAPLAYESAVSADTATRSRNRFSRGSIIATTACASMFEGTMKDPSQTEHPLHR